MGSDKLGVNRFSFICIMHFSEKELKFIHDQDFLLTKAEILEKVRKLLEDTRYRLQEQILNSSSLPPKEIIQGSGKISRGENYRKLPYLVLDYPANFCKPDIFAYRTMFWWGHFFSCTLHLQGQYLEMYKHKIADKPDDFPRNTFICINSTPWEYHYGNDNYIPFKHGDQELLFSKHFLKLSWQTPLEKWQNVPDHACNIWAAISTILNFE